MNPFHKLRSRRALAILLFTGCALFRVGDLAAATATKNHLPAETVQALDGGEPRDFYVEIEDRGVWEALEHMRRVTGLAAKEENEETIALRAERFGEIKARVLEQFAKGELSVLHRYEHLNLMYVRAGNRDVLDRLLSHPWVRKVYPSEKVSPSMAESLPMIEQEYAANLGYKGAGTVVAVIDTGVDFLRQDGSGQKYFGNCIQPPWYNGCKLIYALDCTTGADNCLVDDSPAAGNTAYNHGTHVAATILAVAPETRIASLRIFTSGTDSIYDTRLTQAVEQIVASKASSNIVAANMSFNYYTPKSSGSCDAAHPFAANLIAQLTQADIVPVVSAGNALDAADYSVGRTQMKSPACIQGALSVSSVIDHNGDPAAWGTLCNDPAGSQWKVSCWAMRSSTTDILAPGELITAAGMTMRGTSMAAPHVSGAVAILRGKESLTQSQAQQRLINTGSWLLDTASGVWYRFLNVRQAIQ